MIECEKPEVIYALRNTHIEIIDAAYAHLNTEWHSSNATAAFSRVYLIESGEGKIICNGESISLLPGNIYVVPAESQFSYYCPDHLNKLFFHILAPTIYSRDMFTAIHKCVIFENKAELIAEIKQYFNSNSFPGILLMQEKIREIMIDAYCLSPIEDDGIIKLSDVVKKALKYIENNYRNGITAEKTAAELFVSPSKLQKHFRNEIGVPIGKYINNRILSAAEKDLRNSSMTIKEISEKYGFCDQFYFARAFANRYGNPPSLYRKIK